MEKDFLGVRGRECARREEIGSISAGFFGNQSTYPPRQPFAFLPGAEDRPNGINFNFHHSSGFRSIPNSDPFAFNYGFQSQDISRRAFIRPDPFAALATPLAGFPTLASPAIRRSGFNPAGGNPQLTIFYGGSICVFEDVPADKARAIMFMASNATGVTSEIIGDEGGDVISSIPSASGSTASDELSATPIATRSRFQAIPQARKATLERFMEKRKERLARPQPYMVSFKSDPRGAYLQL